VAVAERVIIFRTKEEMAKRGFISKMNSMKTKADYQRFADELKALCEKHGIVLQATCRSEGIGGELTLLDPNQFDYPISGLSYDVDMDTKSDKGYEFMIYNESSKDVPFR